MAKPQKVKRDTHISLLLLIRASLQPCGLRQSLRGCDSCEDDRTCYKLQAKRAVMSYEKEAQKKGVSGVAEYATALWFVFCHMHNSSVCIWISVTLTFHMLEFTLKKQIMCKAVISVCHITAYCVINHSG